MQKPENVEAYIAGFPEEAQIKLEQMRALVKKHAKKAEESISYGMPAYKLNGALVYFAAYKNHIGFYPTGKGIAAFKDQLADYKHSKGAIQFPMDKKLPVALITSIIKFRVQENLAKKK